MKKPLLLLAAVSIAGYSTYRVLENDAPPPRDHDASLVQDRVWIDHIPRNDKDTIQVFAALTEQPLGVFQASSTWRGSFEIFRYEAHGEELRVLFPQTGDREQVRAKATRCDKGGMDYCLVLDGSSRGVKRYYSREGWEIGSVGDIAKVTATLTK